MDHPFFDAVAAVRKAFDDILLEHQQSDERLQHDLLSGDYSWETTYSVPGDGEPPRVRADVALDWPTWSQAAWRSISLGEPADDPPELGLEIVLRVQRLAAAPDLAAVLSVAPETGPTLGDDTPAERVGPTVEESFGRLLDEHEYAVEVVYEGAYRMDDPASPLRRTVLEEHLQPLAPWVASGLVRLGDLRFEFLPPDTESEGRP